MHDLVGFIDNIHGVDIPGSGVDGDLTGYKEQAACLDCLIIGADGVGGIAGFDDLFFHDTNIACSLQVEACNMKIAVSGGLAFKKELESQKTTERLEWAWVDAVEDLQQHRDAHLYLDLDFRMEPARIAALGRLLPMPVMVNSVAGTLREIGQPFIRINAWPGFTQKSHHELVAPDALTGEVIGQLYTRLGWQYRFVPDIPGMISARILATIINEAYYTLQEAVSTKEEIDTAMKLGTNYPFGPFEWSRMIGLKKIDQLLRVMSRTDERYLPAKALQQELGD